MTTSVKALRAAVNTTHITLDRIENIFDFIRERAYQLEVKAAAMNVDAKQKALEISQLIVAALMKRLGDAQFDLADAQAALDVAEAELKQYELEDAGRAA